MATPEIKNTASSGLREAKRMGEQIVDETTPKIRETIDQVSEVASDLYGKAQGWINEGNNRNILFVGIAAAAGLVGFLIGRGLKPMSSNEL